MLTLKQKEIRTKTRHVLACADSLRIWVRVHKAVDLLSSPRVQLISEADAVTMHAGLDSNIEQALCYLESDLSN
jgi:hypothetical protein